MLRKAWINNALGMLRCGAQMLDQMAGVMQCRLKTFYIHNAVFVLCNDDSGFAGIGNPMIRN